MGEFRNTSHNPDGSTREIYFTPGEIVVSLSGSGLSDPALSLDVKVTNKGGISPTASVVSERQAPFGASGSSLTLDISISGGGIRGITITPVSMNNKLAGPFSGLTCNVTMTVIAKKWGFLPIDDPGGTHGPPSRENDLFMLDDLNQWLSRRHLKLRDEGVETSDDILAVLQALGLVEKRSLSSDDSDDQDAVSSDDALFPILEGWLKTRGFAFMHEAPFNPDVIVLALRNARIAHISVHGVGADP